MKRVLAVLVTLLLLLRWQVALAATPGEIQARLAPFKTLQGRFEQSKHIQGIRRPLRSSGRFVVVRGKGVLWLNERPLASQLRITAEGLSVFSNGVRQKGLDGTAAPQRLIGQVALALFSSDTEALQAQFRMEGSVHGKTWSAQLFPKDPGMARAITSIHLKGGAFAQALELREANGDLSLIRFLDVKADQALRPNESALFE